MGTGLDLAGRRKDGSNFPAEIALSIITTADGMLVSAAIRDITERKLSEAKFRGLLEASADAILGVDSDGVVVLANVQAERLFGCPRVELLGQRLETLVPEGSGLDTAAPRSMGGPIELTGRRQDGSNFPAEISLSAIETVEGSGHRRGPRRDRPHRGACRAGALRRPGRAGAAGGAAAPVAAAGEPRPARRRRRARLQQPARRDPQLRRLRRRGGRPSATADGALADGRATTSAQIQPAAERAAELTHQLLAFARREVVQPAGRSTSTTWSTGLERAAAPHPRRAHRARRSTWPAACRRSWPTPARSSRCSSTWPSTPATRCPTAAR